MKFLCHQLSIHSVILALLMLSAFGEPERMVLSTEGSGRATAYIESPKIISFHGKTHVAWLDTPAEGFRIRTRTLDQTTGQCYLHVIYYSHHHPFRYRRSVRPNDASAWTEYEEFGRDLTYPSMVCSADGTLIMVARRSFEDKPWHLEMWIKPPGQPWSRQQAILSARYGVYSQYGASLAWGADHRTLHLSFRLYELPDYDTKRSEGTVAYLVSPDGGETWQTSSGRAVTLPATADTVDVIAHGLEAHDRVLHAGSSAVGPDGLPYIPYDVRVQETCQSYLATPLGDGRWNHLNLNQFLPPAFREWGLYMHGGIAFGTTGQPTLVGTVMRPTRTEHEWGHPSTELVRFRSRDGGQTFIADIIDSPNPDSPRWMPNIERPTGFNEMSAHPSFIYTDGVRGGALKDQLSNQVIFVPGTPAP